jgi:hypothetical protein
LTSIDFLALVFRPGEEAPGCLGLGPGGVLAQLTPFPAVLQQVADEPIAQVRLLELARVIGDGATG